MKNTKAILLAVCLMMVGIVSAQRGDRAMQEATPAQLASVQSKKMTLMLDLDQQQQQKVEQLLLKEIKDRKQNKIDRESLKSLSVDEKVARREQRLEKKIAMKREMKNILNEDQYKRWQRMMAKKANRRKHAKNGKRPGRS
ncbi:guided entry of tail-anchored proteins factor 1 [Nonlabens xiamenensis]|uniref:hypothetical protein n=1 Tax=Nonlabens xiamenensis TaxID=2341043 RepID=UPI000F61099F|nr:hypothetical protein [Nonlabens xiamenensis]